MSARGVVGALLCCVATVLGACSSGAGRAATSSSTPPAVQRTVAAGTTLQATDPATAHMKMHGHSHGHVHPPASVVPNGTGSYAVAVPNADGCDHSYGTPTQCIPLRAPGGGRMTCAVLRKYHYLPLLVSRDRLGLTAVTGSTTRRVGGRTYLTGCPA